MEEFKNKVVWTALLGVLIISFLLGGYVGSEYFSKDKYVYKTVSKIDTLKKYDTVEKIIKIPEVKIKKVAEVEYISDTVYIKTRPFIAKADTVFKDTKDTLEVKFGFPSFVFDINMRYSPRKERVVFKYITLETEKEEAWWIHPAWASGGLLTGYLLGSIK